MAIPVSNEGSNPIGHAWLRRELNLAVPPPAVESYVVAGARRTEERGRRIVEQYPRQYATEGSIVAHLRFALDSRTQGGAVTGVDTVRLLGSRSRRED